MFESKKRSKIFYDSADRNFNAKTGATIQDKIPSINTNDSNDAFNNDINFAVSTEYRTQNGYVDSAKIELTQFDSIQDGIVDNQQVDPVVDPSTNSSTKYIFQKLVKNTDGTERYQYCDATEEYIYIRQTSVGAIGDYPNGSIVYLIDSDSFKQVNTTTNTTTDVTNYVKPCW